MRDRPAVDIIIRNYNYSAFLCDAIDSALSQTYPRVRVIVVDDGSTDGSRALIGGYGGRVVPVFQENGGEGAAINAGWAHAKGDLVIYLDADDVLAPSAVARVIAAWAPDVGRVAYPLRLMNERGQLAQRCLPRKVAAPPPIEEALSRFGAPFCGTQSCNVYSAWVLKQILPLDQRRWLRAPDTYLSSVASLLGRTVYLDQPQGGYRVHKGALSISNSLNITADRHALMVRPNLQQSLDELMTWLGRPRVQLALNSYHYWMRITSLRFEAAGHPFAGDRIANLVRDGLKAAWSRPGISPLRRFAYSVVLVYTGLAPSWLVRRTYPELVHLSRKVVTFQPLFGGKGLFREHWRDAFSRTPTADLAILAESMPARRACPELEGSASFASAEPVNGGQPQREGR